MLLMYMLLDGIQVCVSFGTSMTVFGCVGDVGGVGGGFARVMFWYHILVTMTSLCRTCLSLCGMTC